MSANSLHEQIRAAIQSAQAEMAGGNVQRGRAWPMAEQDQELVKVYLDQSTVTQFSLGGQPNDWNTRVRCEYHARGTTADNAEVLADALLVQGLELVLADPTLGGLAIIGIEPIAMAWSSDDADTSVGIAQCLFQVVHRTPAHSIAA